MLCFRKENLSWHREKKEEVDKGFYRAQRKESKEVDNRRGEKKKLKSGQEWTLSAQLWQLKTG